MPDGLIKPHTVQGSVRQWTMHLTANEKPCAARIASSLTDSTAASSSTNEAGVYIVLVLLLQGRRKKEERGSK